MTPRSIVNLLFLFCCALLLLGYCCCKQTSMNGHSFKSGNCCVFIIIMHLCHIHSFFTPFKEQYTTRTLYITIRFHFENNIIVSLGTHIMYIIIDYRTQHYSLVPRLSASGACVLLYDRCTRINVKTPESLVHEITCALQG